MCITRHARIADSLIYAFNDMYTMCITVFIIFFYSENLLSENSVSIEFNTKEEWMKKEVNGYEEDWEEEGEEEDEWEEVKEKDEEEEHVEGEESQEESFVHPSMHGSVSTLTSEYLEQLAVQNSSLASPDRKSREKSE